MLSESDKDKAENVLTELLLAAMSAPEHVKSSFADMASGVADALEPERIERAKQYAMFRFKNMVDSK